MANVGFATLSVIPSFQGFQSRLSAGVAAPMAQSGKAGGKKFGDAAGQEAATRFQGGLTNSLKGMALPFAGILAGAGIAEFFRGAFDEAKEAGEVSRVTAKLIESTGKAAGLTAVQVGDLAERMMDYAAVDDELVQAGANIMLTFRNVKNAAGEGNDIFDRSIKAGLDLAAVLGTDLSSSALQLGKALNDPIKGVTALGRAGVQFTEQQKAQIKTLTQSGDLLSAQKIILKEVESQVGGAAGAAADGTDRLAVAMGNLKEAVGVQLMPAVESFSNWAVDDGIPALMSAGGAVRDAAEAFGQLPPPVKAAAGAFVALQVASRLGISDGLRASVGTAAGQLESLRLRTMLAADAFREARTTTVAFNGNVGSVDRGVGRLAASMQALRVGAQGAGSALRSGLSGAIGILGGPWGIAITAATVGVAHFWQENQEAKSRVDALADSLNKQTGAITDNTNELAFNSLEKAGALDAARTLGIGLDDVRKAALGDTDAIGRLNTVLDENLRYANVSPEAYVGLTKAQVDGGKAAKILADAIGESNGELDQARDKTRNYADFMGKEAPSANGEAADSFQSLSERIRAARGEIERLMDAEDKRTLSRVQAKRDELALLETMKAATAEAREGKKTLDESTEAGRANWNALLDVADQWNNSKDKVTNARGAYKNMRDEFIKLAEKMGASDEKAKRLADRLLKLPDRKKIDVTTPGMDKALADLERLRARVADSQALAVYVSTKQANDPRLGNNANGTRSWRGGPTWVGERGPEIVNLPRGASVTPNHQIASGAGITVEIGQVVAHDYNDFMSQAQMRARRAALAGRRP